MKSQLRSYDDGCTYDSGGSRPWAKGGGGGGGLDLLALSGIFPSVISSFFTQNKRGGRAPRAPPLDPPLYDAKFQITFWPFFRFYWKLDR